MLLTLTTTHQPTSDLGYLLYKHPGKVQRFTQSFGEAVVFYPQVDETRCTVALLVDIDPVRLVRGAAKNNEGPLSQYVNDRPYAASSLLAVALGDVFRSALNGQCKERPELVEMVQSLEIGIPVLPCRGGEQLLRGLFEPLGYQVEAHSLPFDETFSAWGDSPYYTVRLTITETVQKVLCQLTVLLPVLDNSKHYWVADDEVEKLLRRGTDWLSDHPLKETIAERYLRHQQSLTRRALARLESVDAEVDEDEQANTAAATEEILEKPLSLNHQRLNGVLAEIKALGATNVVDMGCGDGKLLSLLGKEKTLQRIVGMDVSIRSLEIAQSRLERLAPMQRARIELLHGSLTYRDKRLEGFEVATCIEVIEHLDANRIHALTRALFEFAHPKAVVLTTPNKEYNVLFPGLAEGALRHGDHRFEWTRAEFEAWANNTAQHYGYMVRFADIGEVDTQYGAPTQMAVFCLQ